MSKTAGYRPLRNDIPLVQVGASQGLSTFYVFEDPEVDALVQRRCASCKGFFSHATAKFLPCNFHPGTFRDPATTNLREGATTGWSCCNIQERVEMPAAMAAMAFMPGVSELVFLSQETQRRDCVGCQTNAHHIEDREYTETMAQFPIDKVALKEDHRRRVEQYVMRQTPGRPVAEPASEAELTPGQDDPNFFIHQVKPFDTLIGLSLHYQVTQGAIERANPGQIVGGIFQHLRFIRIPRMAGVRGKEHQPLASTEAQAIVLKDFMRLAKKLSSEPLTKEEATYYCDANDFVLEDAIREYKEDLAHAPTPK